jgi:hypothetical protein
MRAPRFDEFLKELCAATTSCFTAEVVACLLVIAIGNFA